MNEKAKRFVTYFLYIYITIYEPYELIEIYVRIDQYSGENCGNVART